MCAVRCLTAALVMPLLLACGASGPSQTTVEAAPKVEAVKAENKPTEATPAGAKPGEAADAAKTDAAKADPGKTEAAKTEPAKTEATTPTAAPSSVTPKPVKEANLEVVAWLTAPEGKPAPPIVAASAEIELREFCLACPSGLKDKPRTRTLRGVKALTDAANDLSWVAPGGVAYTGTKTKCAKDCCALDHDYENDSDVGIEQVCYKLDADGKAIAVTSIATRNSWQE